MLIALFLACSGEPAAPPTESTATSSAWPIPYTGISPESQAWLTTQGWWPLQIGYFADVPGYAAHYAVMKEDKLLEKRGLTVQYTTFLSGPPILEAFLAGQTQVTSYGDFPFWNTVDKGVGAVAYAVTGVNNEVALLVPPDSPAKTLDDLRGREIVVGTTLGSYAEFYLLSIPNLTYRIAGMSMREAQLVPKGVDAVAVWDPHATFAVQKGLGRKVDDVYPWYFATGYEFARREIAEHCPDVMQALADATVEAVLRVRADPDRAAALYAADPRSKAWTKEQVREQIDRYITLYQPTYKYLHADFWATEDARVVKAQHDAGRLTRLRDAEDLKKDFEPRYIADTLSRLGWKVPERPVFLPPDWAGTVGQPPYPPYLHAGGQPQPWP